MNRIARIGVAAALTVGSTGAVLITRALAAACAVPVTATAISPASGFAVGGTTVTVTGTNFVTCHIDSVSFGPTNGTGLALVDETTLTVVAPAGSGTVTPTLGYDSGNVPAPAYTYVPVPVVTGLRPPKGPLTGGTKVIISGHDLQQSGATTTVTFGTESATIEAASATELTVVSPPGTSAGPVSAAVVVTLPSTEAAASSLPFDYVAAPTVTGVTAATGPSDGGDVITITGTGFLRGALVLMGSSNGGDPAVDPPPGESRFGNDRAAPAVEYVDSEHLRAVTPSGPPGVVSIVVQNPDEQFGALTDGYTYDGDVPAATSVGPGAGPSLGGTSVTIVGTGFVPGATVAFGDGGDRVSAPSVTVNSATEIVATTPPHPPSATPVGVQVTNPNGASSTLAAAFTYDASPAPTLAAVDPIGPAATGSSLGGDTLTILGTGFAVGARVSFGPPFMIGDRVVNPEVGAGVVNAGRLTVNTPAHPAGGVSVIVTNPDGQTTASAPFTFVAAPAPTVTSVSPDTGPTVGTTVTISGTGFAPGARVLVGGTDVRAVTDVDNGVLPLVRSASSIVGITASHAAGAVDVQVVNPDGASVTAVSAFTYTGPPAPDITSISPASGDTLGGLPVVLAGTNFAAGSIVTFGNVDCTGSTLGAACNVRADPSATHVTPTSISTVTPAGVFGFVDVTVVGPDGVAATLPYGFDFGDGAAPPTITSVDPASGPSGATIAINGTGFAHTGGTPNAASDARVALDGTSLVDPPEQTSSTRLTGKVPRSPGGSSTVTVVNPDRQGVILQDGFAYPVDTTAPSTTASAVTGQPPTAYPLGSGNWARGPVTVTLTATDDAGGSGVDRITYSATGAQTLAATSVSDPTANLVITAQGQTELTYAATDIAGHVESANTRSVAIDSVPPSITSSTTFVPGTQTNADVDVVFTCADSAGGSGVVGAITATSSNTITADGANPLTVTFTEIGLNQSATARCVDAAGNVTTKVFGGVNITRFGLDLTASATTADGLAYVAGTWTDQDVVVRFTCTPAAGQIPPGSPQVAMVTPPQYVRTGATDLVVDGECLDTAGNRVTASFAGIRVDKTLPRLTAAATSGGAPYTAGQWTNHPVVVTFTCVDDGPDQSGVATSTAPITVATDGTTAGVEGTCRDVAGNWADPPAFLGPILIDQVPPVCAVTMSPNPLGPVNDKLQFVFASVRTNDDRSGPAGISLVSVTSNRPATASADISGFVPGTASTGGSVRATRGNEYTFTYIAFDRAGSSSAPCVARLRVG